VALAQSYATTLEKPGAIPVLGEAWQSCALLAVDDELKKALAAYDATVGGAVAQAKQANVPLDVGYRFTVGGEAKTSEQRAAETARWNALSAEAKQNELVRRENEAVQRGTVYLGRVHVAAADAVSQRLTTALPFLVGASVGLLQRYARLAIERYDGDPTELDALAALKQAIDTGNATGLPAAANANAQAANASNAPPAPASASASASATAPAPAPAPASNSTRAAAASLGKPRKLIGGRYAVHWNANYEHSLAFCSALLKKIEADVRKFVDDAKTANKILTVRCAILVLFWCCLMKNGILVFVFSVGTSLRVLARKEGNRIL
jgi:hypothetical protein